MSAAAVEGMAEGRRAVVTALKMAGPTTIAVLAERTGHKPEAVRQQLLQLQGEGWVERRSAAAGRGPRGGRPPVVYGLTQAGEHLFPKRYEDLAVLLLDAVAERLGATAANAVLSSVADAKVAAWAPRMGELSMAERVEHLRGVYEPDDPYVEVQATDDGYRLVEHNCPFLEVAQRRPALCSVTVNTLTRLLGVRVVREERFQRGHGRCVFRILADRRVDVRGFEPEP